MKVQYLGQHYSLYFPLALPFFLVYIYNRKLYILIVRGLEWALDLMDMPLIRIDYASQWHSCQFSITVRSMAVLQSLCYSSESIQCYHYFTQSTVHYMHLVFLVWYPTNQLPTAVFPELSLFCNNSSSCLISALSPPCKHSEICGVYIIRNPLLRERAWVYNIQFLLDLASTVFFNSPRELMTMSYRLNFDTP